VEPSIILLQVAPLLDGKCLFESSSGIKYPKIMARPEYCHDLGL
jgi:hypothetical protein